MSTPGCAGSEAWHPGPRPAGPALHGPPNPSVLPLWAAPTGPTTQAGRARSSPDYHPHLHPNLSRPCSLLPCKAVSRAGGPLGFSGPRELLHWGASGPATASMGPADVGTGGATLASRGCSMRSPSDLRGGRATVASVPHCFLNKPQGACPQAGTREARLEQIRM